MLPINLFIDTFGHRLFDSATFSFFFLPFIFYSWAIWESSWPSNNVSNNNIESQPIWKHKFYKELFCDIWKFDIAPRTSISINQMGAYSNYIQREIWFVVRLNNLYYYCVMFSLYSKICMTLFQYKISLATIRLFSRNNLLCSACCLHHIFEKCIHMHIAYMYSFNGLFD